MNRAERRRQRKITGKAGKQLNPTQTVNDSFDQQSLPILQAIDLAVQHNAAGRLPQAENICQQILQADPNQPVALNLLGTIAHKLNNNAIAVELITKALSVKPDYAEAHNNLGFIFQELERIDDAVVHYQKAIDIAPEFAAGHNNLGAALKELGQLDEAIRHIHKAISITPDYTDAHNNLGAVLKELGRFEEAIRSYELVNSAYSRAKTLECLYSLERYEDFYLSLNKLIKEDANNIRAAAISAFASQQLRRADPHPFCKNPIDFIRVYEGLNGMDENDKFLDHLVYELKSHADVWEPPGKSTKNGFQSRTSSNLFSNPVGRFADLKQIIRDNIEKYRSGFSIEHCDFIKLFPKQISLSGWVVRLLKGGHQTEHIHPEGWLSGVCYLQVPKDAKEEEGSIEFGLWGYTYPILNKNYPRKRFHPKNGDIILFPSSLFHRTIPFNSNEERICISFDLIPT